MRVFISADIEGTADLASFAEAGNENSMLYQRGMIQMSKEIAALCQGAKEAGAEFVAVKDSHGNGLNIMHEYLPEGVTLIRGEVRNPYSMVGGIDGTFDAVMFAGYHDAAGGSGNPMAHTVSSRKIREVRINGKLAAELHIFSMAASYLGVPTVLAAGDEAVCRAARAINSQIVTCEIKRGIGAAVASLHPETVNRMLREAARQALSGDRSRFLYALPENFQVSVAYNRHFDAEYASYYPGAKRIDAHTVSYENRDYYEILRFFHFGL